MTRQHAIDDDEPPRPLSLLELHGFVSTALINLHKENVRLQAKLSEHLNGSRQPHELISEFQVLDRHAQILEDLAQGLERLSLDSGLAPESTGETLETLFRLDVTRLATERLCSTSKADDTQPRDSVIF